MIKPFSQACENNGPSILRVLKRVLMDVNTVLEVGSGTGQHAVFFGASLPHLTWQTSDLIDNHQGIHLWLAEAQRENVIAPIVLDVTQPLIHSGSYDAIYTANTLHIMSLMAVEGAFKLFALCVNEGGLLLTYGPFNYGGCFTSDSNARFDHYLKASAPSRGIRDVEWINELALANGFTLEEDNTMPANNRLLIWRYVQPAT